MNCCPTCNQPILDQHRGVRVDLNTNTALCHDTAVQLTRSQAEILYVLSEARPRFVSKDHLLERLFGLSGRDWPGSNLIPCQVSLIRGKLRGLPVKITNNHARGYRLEVST